jgi:recombinational DNA repair ATPase RecF
MKSSEASAKKSGKTSILEAISLLSPGSGIKKAKTLDILKIGESNLSISYELSSYLGNAEIKQSASIDTSKRIIEFNQKTIPQYELINFVNVSIFEFSISFNDFHLNLEIIKLLDAKTF